MADMRKAAEQRRMARLGYEQVSLESLQRPFACLNCGCLVAQNYAEKHRDQCKPRGLM